MRRAASRLLSYFLVRLSLLVTSMAVLPAPYYQIPRFSGDTLTTGPGLSGFWSVPGGSEVIHMPDKRANRTSVFLSSYPEFRFLVPILNGRALSQRFAVNRYPPP